MSTLTERALTVADVCDADLWRDIGAHFPEGADPAPETVRDPYMAVVILVERSKPLIRASVPVHLYRPMRNGAPQFARWVVRHADDRHYLTLTHPFIQEARALLNAHLAAHPEGQPR